MFHAKERLFYYVFPTIFHLKSIFGLKKVKEIKAHREKLHIINQQLLSASQTKEKKMFNFISHQMTQIKSGYFCYQYD